MPEKKKPRKGLGRGLDALFQPEPAAPAETEDSSAKEKAPSRHSVPEGEAVMELKLVDIEPNPAQPRKSFETDKLQDLADSIKQHGMVQPLLVKRQPEGTYLIVAGERRWRAAKLAGLKKVPCIVKVYSDQDVMEIALIENLQREDLNPIEEAEGYLQLMQQFGMTQEKVSARVGKSRSAVANALRLNHLAEEVKQMVVSGELTQGHARALLSLEDTAAQAAAAQRIIKEGLNVRQVEALVAALKEGKTEKSKKKPLISKELLKYYTAAEKSMSSRLGTKVKIHAGKNKSKIEIEYYTKDDLERLLKELS